MKRSKKTDFVICVRSDGTDDLQPRKVYQVLSDQSASDDGYLRIVDESGEDYLYPANYFVAIDLPVTAVKALKRTA